ncbi:FAD-dependent oxidoreductase [Photobacterium sanctipauli]|uniref:FAD-dependent oxidoreductase n=2 Tax=Photobacterium sanctipauli TaxID=1342794 RepID=A0A2T3NBN6_9GAMM|nr:FAD-dependent oxidoreductase [Photobacterium sanctipauli]PSW11358.1 FAD-dependent oxidoreductase [Photobacterium sanctipauli]
MNYTFESRQYEVVIVGGGISGVCAALAAARHGTKVALLQNRSVLGGNASSEVRMHICGADYHASKQNARETGIVEEILLDNRLINPQHSFSVLDTVLWEKVTFQDNLDLFLNTHMTEVEMDGNRIVSIKAEQTTTERRFEFFANNFIDTSGDAVLSLRAGADIRTGREARHEYDEELAPAQADNVMMGNTLMFESKDMGYPVPFKKPEWANTYTEDDLKDRSHRDITAGYWWIELGGTELDTTKDGEVIRDELLKAVYGIWDHIKNGGDHGADNYVLDWVGMLPGKRDSRRILGDYVLNANDLFGARVFEDTVAYGGWPMDMHVKDGLKSKESPTKWIETNDMYSIPYRSLYSRNIDNLFVGGRNISASHMAFGSTRVMATCGVIGQAIGTAAAIANEQSLTPRGVNAQIKELQHRLIKDDCYLFGIQDTDPKNLALQATISASSEQAGFEASKVNNGYQRNIGDNHNLWVSEPLENGEASLTLDFGKTIQASEVVVNFDSQLSNELMITISKPNKAAQRPGFPLEIVKDYRIECLQDGHVVHQQAINNNHLRHNKINLAQPVNCDAIKLTVLTTHGDPCARIFEVKVF